MILNGRCWNSVTGHQNERKTKTVPKNIKQITENVTISDEHTIVEDWKDVKLYLNGRFVKIDGYKVNRDTQQVKSFKYDKVNGKIVNVSLRNGYPVLSLQYDTNISRVYNVHKVMMDTFKPENADTLPAINHINGNKTDNRLENLERCTNSYNIKHNFDVLGYKGLRGEECHLSKLTEIQVKEIDKLLREGELTQYQIADRYSVKRHIISDIYNGRAWSYLTGRVPTKKKYVAKKHGISKNIVRCIKLGTTHSFVTGHDKGAKPTKSSDTTLDDFFEKGSI